MSLGMGEDSKCITWTENKRLPWEAVSKQLAKHHHLTGELRWECLGMAKPGGIWWLSLGHGPGPAVCALAPSFPTPHSKETLVLSSTKRKKGNQQMLQDRHSILDVFNCNPRGVLPCPSTLWSSGQL